MNAPSNKPPGAIQGLTAALKNVAGDAIELAQMQAELFKLELNAFRMTAIHSLCFISIGLCTFVASLPVVLFAIAGGIAEAFEIQPWKCLLTVGVILVASSFLLLYVGGKRLKTASASFEQSAAELKKNFGWITAMMRENSNNQ